MPEGQYSGGSGYIDNRLGWAGYLWDPNLEVYHVRHRVYDSADGRWLQPDPIGHAGGWNLYEYGGGDYANTIDPWGLYGLFTFLSKPFEWVGLGGVTDHFRSVDEGIAAIFDGTASDLLAARAVQYEINANGGRTDLISPEGAMFNVAAAYIGAEDIGTAAQGWDVAANEPVEGLDRFAAGLRGGATLVLTGTAAAPVARVSRGIIAEGPFASARHARASSRTAPPPTHASPRRGRSPPSPTPPAAPAAPIANANELRSCGARHGVRDDADKPETQGGVPSPLSRLCSSEPHGPRCRCSNSTPQGHLHDEQVGSDRGRHTRDHADNE